MNININCRSLIHGTIQHQYLHSYLWYKKNQLQNAIKIRYIPLSWSFGLLVQGDCYSSRKQSLICLESDYLNMLILCKKTNLDKNLPTEVCVIVHTGPPVRDVNNEEKKCS